MMVATLDAGPPLRSGGASDRDAARTSFTPATPTMPDPVGTNAGYGGSCRASRKKVSRAARNLAVTDGRSNVLTPGSTASGACPSATSDAPNRRTAKRHLGGLHKPCGQPHHTQPVQTVLSGTLNRSTASDDVSDGRRAPQPGDRLPERRANGRVIFTVSRRSASASPLRGWAPWRKEREGHPAGA